MKKQVTNQLQRNESSIRCCAADRGQHSFLSDYVSAQGSERINELQEKQVMEKCTDTVVNWMIRCNAINEADKELYKYALYSFFSIGITTYPCRSYWLWLGKRKTRSCSYFSVYGTEKI